MSMEIKQNQNVNEQKDPVVTKTVVENLKTGGTKTSIFCKSDIPGRGEYLYKEVIKEDIDRNGKVDTITNIYEENGFVKHGLQVKKVVDMDSDNKPDQESEYSYDFYGFPSRVTNTEYTYDSFGNLTKKVTTENREMEYGNRPL